MSQLKLIEKPNVSMSIKASTSTNNSTPLSSSTTTATTQLTAPLPEVLANGDHAIKIKTEVTKEGNYYFLSFLFFFTIHKFTVFFIYHFS